ncbi:MAG TPA: DUF2520 domain-containing protein [Burkholderiales bacterium]|jgi:predicted short-subunit dehydrogenase-like oxidoreductase (DUF2520 family)|nr:DUF2520 domain-containing protein [Burkholderiales bacterium]
MAAKKPRLGIIGAGRVGTALAMNFSGRGYAVVAVASRSVASSRKLVRRIRGARATSSLQEVADRAELVFITVPDDAIEAVASRIRWRAGAACVHCSGAGDLDLLIGAAAQGARVGGFHPLRMFGEPGKSIDMRGCAVAIAGSDALARELERLARAIGARPLRLPGGGRALYHAAANFSGAFVVALIAETVALWKKLGIAEKDALRALLPLLRGSVDNVEKLGAAGALGSVIARGDAGTIRRHLEALAQAAPESLELYRLLSLRTIPLALAKGTLKPGAAKRIEALLHAGGH